jgi:predicted nucleic acid-binding protein
MKKSSEVTPVTPPDPIVAAAEKIQILKAKADHHTSELKIVQEEMRAAFQIINQAQMGFAPNMSMGLRHRAKVMNPRPVYDKLMISVGRKIVEGHKERLPIAETKQNAQAAAEKLAKKYKLMALPPEVLASIERIANSKYGIY